MAVNLTNDKLRREFVDNPDNWETIGDLKGLVRLSRLEYKSLEWFSVWVRQTHVQYDYRVKDVVPETKWWRKNIYKIDKTTRALTYGMSTTQVVDEIKEYDKKEKETS